MKTKTFKPHQAFKELNGVPTPKHCIGKNLMFPCVGIVVTPKYKVQCFLEELNAETFCFRIMYEKNRLFNFC